MIDRLLTLVLFISETRKKILEQIRSHHGPQLKFHVCRYNSNTNRFQKNAIRKHKKIYNLVENNVGKRKGEEN